MVRLDVWKVLLRNKGVRQYVPTKESKTLSPAWRRLGLALKQAEKVFKLLGGADGLHR